MAYRRFKRHYKPTVRTITVKYAGKCIGCGCVIPVGAIADYYPVGTIAGIDKPQIAHLKALTGDSKSCFVAVKQMPHDFVDVDSQNQWSDMFGQPKTLRYRVNPLRESDLHIEPLVDQQFSDLESVKEWMETA